MVIREAGGQIGISGSPAELNTIADKIEALTNGELLIEAEEGANPEPYDRCLSALHARVTNGPVRVAVSVDRVIVTGSISMFRVFASYFRFSEGAVGGTHVHHEWFDGNEYIARDSAPLVISIR